MVCFPDEKDLLAMVLTCCPILLNTPMVTLPAFGTENPIVVVGLNGWTKIGRASFTT